MASKHRSLLLATCFLLSGCGVYKNAARTLLCEPLRFARSRDSRLTQDWDGCWADVAWEEALAANPDIPSSVEYQRGFKEGFADYLYAGGSGRPPAVPPRRFWKLDYRTPDGRRIVDDWFAGFRHGAAVARDGDYRRLVTVPSSLPPDQDTDAPARSNHPAGQTDMKRPT